MTPRARRRLRLLGKVLHVLVSIVLIGLAFFAAAVIELNSVAHEAALKGLMPPGSP